ncbi:acyl-CoA carboxylase epsilon subunit [Streptomyces longwoodensis]|uniref:acyl-CoA carboxylase epsilon subunit n=1 Tax=Streptomyces longwoodensis TaxID=68231 RepID=UPI0033C920AC
MSGRPPAAAPTDAPRGAVGAAGPLELLREAAFRVVRGNPDADELAALVAVLVALHGRADAGGGAGAGAADDAAGAAPRATWDRAGHAYHSPLAWVL